MKSFVVLRVVWTRNVTNPIYPVGDLKADEASKIRRTKAMQRERKVETNPVLTCLAN